MRTNIHSTHFCSLVKFLNENFYNEPIIKKKRVEKARPEMKLVNEFLYTSCFTIDSRYS